MTNPFYEKPSAEMSEIEILRADNERMRDLLDRRPALNAGLYESYVAWTRLCYISDATFAGLGESEVH